MKSLLNENYDAVFVGTGAPLGKHLDLPGYSEVQDRIHTGIEWLGERGIRAYPGYWQARYCAGRRQYRHGLLQDLQATGGETVTVAVRSGFDEMKASPWEIEDAIAEDIPILNFHVPKRYLVEEGRLVGMEFEKVRKELDENGRRMLVPTGEEPVIIPCDDVICAIGQENSFPGLNEISALSSTAGNFRFLTEIPFSRPMKKCSLAEMLLSGRTISSRQ